MMNAESESLSVEKVRTRARYPEEAAQSAVDGIPTGERGNETVEHEHEHEHEHE
jgi:hypothetical protein